MNMIKLRYMIKNGKTTLMLFKVPHDSLKQFSQDNSKYSFINLPENKFRLFGDEFKGSDDAEKEKEDESQFANLDNSDEPDMDFNENRYSMLPSAQETEPEPEEKKVPQTVAEKEKFEFDELAKDLRKSSMMRSRRPSVVTLQNFNILKQIGRGTFGRVYLAELDVNKQLYAIKAIRKDVLIEYD